MSNGSKLFCAKFRASLLLPLYHLVQIANENSPPRLQCPQPFQTVDPKCPLFRLTRHPLLHAGCTDAACEWCETAPTEQKHVRGQDAPPVEMHKLRLTVSCSESPAALEMLDGATNDGHVGKVPAVAFGQID